ncbi:TetR/AcrR family transcriptional regulator [Cryptosporangium minutisporangium]|uniref:TetR/AcrR family transcriptional regulator n=1 Tax=Cryptosporangium minutisporangium TaxID=113569 RepID=A0ABP6T6P2_9ACTN
MAGRREQALDAAVRVLGSQGTRALTHRAVDAEGDLPAGTTSNYFRSRDALLSGILGRLLEQEKDAFAALAGEPHPVSADELAGRLGAMLRQLAGPARPMTLARYAIFVEAAHQKPMRLELLAWSRSLWSWAGEWLAALGSDRPEEHAREVLAFADGLLLHRLSRGGDGEFAPEASLAALLRALVEKPVDN